jgi:hypothetical protein
MLYVCIPSQQTVSPCPAGTAPNQEVILSNANADRYLGKFDHIPLQDVLVGLALVFSFLIGMHSGRKR